MRIPTTRVAAVVLICIGIGVVTVIGVTLGQYYYMGQGEDGHHRFISDDGQSVVTMDNNDVPDVEQARNDLQEMKLLSEQGQRELVKVVRTDVNGEFERRIFIYKYSLADGRTREMGEAAPDHAGRWTLTGPQHEEMIQLKKAGPGKDLGTYDEDIQGRTFTFRRQQYVLRDGTEVVWSIGEPGNTP